MKKKTETLTMLDALEEVMRGPQPRPVLENVPDYTQLLGTIDDDAAFLIAVSGRWGLKRAVKGEFWISGAVRGNEKNRTLCKQVTCYEVTTDELRQGGTYTLRDHMSEKMWMTDRDEIDIDNLMRVADQLELGGVRPIS